MKIYARNYGSGNSQDFSRGEYNIPANYVGTAFTTDKTSSQSPEEAVHYEYAPKDSELLKESISESKAESDHLEEALCAGLQKSHPKESGAPKESLLRSLLSRFERGFEFDDLLLLGLIFLLLQGGSGDRGKNKDEMVLILAFLFLTGF